MVFRQVSAWIDGVLVSGRTLLSFLFVDVVLAVDDVQHCRPKIEFSKSKRSKESVRTKSLVGTRNHRGASTNFVLRKMREMQSSSLDSLVLV